MVEGAKDRRTAQKQHPMLWWKRKKKGRMRHKTNQNKREEREKGISLQNKISKQVHRHPPSAEDIEMVAMLETLQARCLHPRPARRQISFVSSFNNNCEGAAQHNAALIGGVKIAGWVDSPLCCKN